MAFVSAIVGNIFLNGKKTTNETNPFLDPLSIFNCPIFYARTLNSVLATDAANQQSKEPAKVAFKPKTLFTAEGLTAPVYGRIHEPLDVIPADISNFVINRPYILQELKDQHIYGKSVLPGGSSDDDNGNSDGADASICDAKNPTKSWTADKITVQP